jgi:prepilin-type N-terminal cleavage/methylation domain-containing protein
VATSHAIRRSESRGFTLLELLVVIGIIAVLTALLMAGFSRSQRMALRVACMNNLKQFVTADLGYYADNGVLPAMDSTVPSSIKVAHLTMMAGYLKTPVPAGPVMRWPKRINQPAWYNCPRARTSGYAEGPTMGGGVYTGYLYVSGIQDTAMVATGVATLPNPDHSARRRNFTRGVMWADILDEFRTADPRRFECFHTEVGHLYSDFVFPKTQLEGIHRAWSDGSVEWVPIEKLDLSGPGSPDLQINHLLGNYYY